MGARSAAPLGMETSGRFDSCFPDCDVRELVNPARRERVLDGIETRTSPQRSRRRTRWMVS